MSERYCMPTVVHTLPFLGGSLLYLHVYLVSFHPLFTLSLETKNTVGALAHVDREIRVSYLRLSTVLGQHRVYILLK